MDTEQSIIEASRCLFPECGRKAISKGLCYTHYSQQRCGEEMRPIVGKGGRKAKARGVCSFEDCGKIEYARGLCNAHHTQQRRGFTLKPLRERGGYKPCGFEGCEAPVRTNGLCHTHAEQKRLGKELKPIRQPKYEARTSAGYLKLKRPNHPNADGHGYILEHRLIMSEMLGRPLLPDEQIHHKDGCRSNNDPSNLELRSGGHGAGARVEDKLIEARRVLSIYGTDEEKRAIEKG